MQNDFLGGYEMLRKIGSGGYGAVYLAKKGGTKKYFALKIIESEKAPREISAFKKYQTLSLEKKSFICPIADFGSADGLFYYAMPLADALETSKNISPENPNWEARSLSNEIRLMGESPEKKWFSAEEIREYIKPIFDAAIFLGENETLHRDIKPDNILFFGSKPRLCDIGLLADDTKSLSGMGTPFFSAPNWYLSSGGNPDMYGLATTFYMLISGNFPDLIGRAAYNFPEKIKDALSEKEQQRYKHWMRCIYRALAQAPNERYVRLQDFLEAVMSDDFEISKSTPAKSQKKFGKKKIAVCALVCLCAAALPALYLLRKQKSTATNADAARQTGEQFSNAQPGKESIFKKLYPEYSAQEAAEEQTKSAELSLKSLKSAKPYLTDKEYARHVHGILKFVLRDKIKDGAR